MTARRTFHRAFLGGLAAYVLPAAALPHQEALLARGPLPARAPERAAMQAVARAGDRLVAVGEHGVIALSDDGGRHWRNAASVPVDTTLTALRFLDARQGWAVGHLGVVLRSVDGGEHWTKVRDGQASGSTDKPLFDLWLTSAEQALVIGAFNSAHETRDGGRTWTSVSERFDNPNLLHLYGITEHQGQCWVVGEQGLLLGGKPGGVRYAPLASPYIGSLFGLTALPGGERLVYGIRGHAFMSDAQAGWKRVHIPAAGASFNLAAVLKDGTVLLGDQSGKLFASRNGAQTFQRIDFAWGAPLTGAAEAPDGGLVLASLGGMARLGPELLMRAAA